MKGTSSGLVSICWNDYLGITRTRGIPASQLDNFVNNGLGWALANYAITPFGPIAPNPWGPTGEVRQFPDKDVHVRIEGDETTPALEMYLGSPVDEDGSPWKGCPRSFAQRAFDALNSETGLQIRIAAEHEFLLAAPDFHPSVPLSLDAIRNVAEFADTLVRIAEEADIGLEACEPEFGIGQYEVSCSPAPGTEGLDRIVFTREIVREAARRTGYHATFSPKPTVDGVGNGMHLHFSLLDDDGSSQFFDPGEADNLSELGRRFVAGILYHAADYLALTAPIPISYLRLGPGVWSCGFNAVGYQNRECLLRICPPPPGKTNEKNSGWHLEFRAIDGACNPYLALGAIIHAGLNGIRNDLPAPTSISEDPAALSPRRLKQLGIFALPDSLHEALDHFEKSKIMKECLDPEMMEVYLSVKRFEVEDFRKHGEGASCERYQWAY